MKSPAQTRNVRAIVYDTFILGVTVPGRYRIVGLMDPLRLLERHDKWFLGGGSGALYAPPFPKALTVPGFWDECYLADLRIPRLFGAVLLDSNGKPVRLRSEIVGWRPDRLELLHSADRVALRERRCVLPNQTWVSEFLLEGARKTLACVMWVLLPSLSPGVAAPWQSVTDCDVDETEIVLRWDTRWPSETTPDRSATESEAVQVQKGSMLSPVPLFLAFGGSSRRVSWDVALAQKHEEAPIYEASMLPELWKGGKLSNSSRFPDYEGLLHVYQHYVLEPGVPLILACGAGLSRSAASKALAESLSDDPLSASEESWRAYFASVPQLECSDHYLETAYWYRWFGLRLNTVDVPDLPMVRTPKPEPTAAQRKRREREGDRPELPGTFEPFVTEGVGFFRNFITYSAQTHLRETAWMHSPRLGLGILANLARCQRPDGSYPGHNYSARPPRDFYHADFGTGARLIREVHGIDFDRSVVESLRHFSDFYTVARVQPKGTGMVEVWDQNETGQEYMSRYQVASDKADEWGSFRIGGVDATTYAYSLCAALYELEPGSKDFWNTMASFPAVALARHSFDPTDAFFCDVLPDGRRSPARPATGFYPLASPAIYLLAEFPGRSRLLQMVERWLLDPEQFWLEKGFPATAMSDSTFRAAPEWKDRRMNCPWNGRSWPMVNSHLVDALANVARVLESAWRDRAGEAVQKAVRLLFHGDDPTRPNCFEHYNPVTGTPALYRGYDDYMHSWVVDLIMRHVVGVIPRGQVGPLEGGSEMPAGWTLDPLPIGADLQCSDIPHPQGRLTVSVESGQASWRLDGA